MSQGERDNYTSPLGGRYASPEMRFLFSDDRKFKGPKGWRGIWYNLALAQKALGIEQISDEQLAEMKLHLSDAVDYRKAAALERELRHDVMTHIHIFGEVCPSAAGVMALAATSCDTTDNVELVIMRDGLSLICNGLARVIDRLSRFAQEFRSLPTLGSTHFQAAALTTPGKRACMWMQSFLMDLEHIEWIVGTLRLRGLKGATGTQASFLELFEGDHEKVLAMERHFAQSLGFDKVFTITGQTYPRKVDSQILNALSGVAQSASKMATDIRLLAHDKEMEEPFEDTQVGSSGMPWKRNPMRTERGCSLSRITLAMSLATQITESVQFLERSLDDSAVRRIAIAEAFLSADAILKIMQNVSEGLVVYPKVIRRRVDQELPFMAVEKILIAMVKAGVSRQECHERIRVHSQAAAAAVKVEGLDNDLMDRIGKDQYFAPIHEKLNTLVNPDDFIGRAPEQVDAFLQDEVAPALEPYRDMLAGSAELSV